MKLMKTKQDLVNWIKRRIAIKDVEKAELDKELEMNRIISIGGQLTAYKQILEYVNSHLEDNSLEFKKLQVFQSYVPSNNNFDNPSFDIKFVLGEVNRILKNQNDSSISESFLDTKLMLKILSNYIKVKQL